MNTTITATRPATCARCGDTIHIGEQMVWVRHHARNPQLGKKNSNTFHIDPYCGHKTEGEQQ